ncbi:MAG TPA: extracellular solute-binding protein [Polyangia bacterium]|nr:extracellular solute-binding protein [Polyangia bacterium]
MKQRAIIIIALLAVLAAPFVARSGRRAARSGTGAAETLVVLTPHNQAVRYEFGRAFREHMARQGRHVDIDWRTPGGTAEISRVLVGEYTASFQLYWTRTLGRRWSSEIAAGFMRLADRAGEVADARQAFLQSDVSCGVDLLFGGGSTEHARQADAGRLVDSGFVTAHPELFGPKAIPQSVGDQPFWDAQGRWIGTCLSTFGICFNRDLLGRLGVGVPTSWEALADPRLRGQVALADPNKSGSAATVFESLVQREMQLVGPDEGWAHAVWLIRRIGGNARYWSDAAAAIPLDVAGADAAAGTCIDYYGRFQADTAAAGGHPDRVGFSVARGETVVNADPVGLLRGAPHRELALAFIAFVLSPEGQRLWSLPHGAAGGPERYTLDRSPILPGLTGEAGEDPYREARQFGYHAAWTAPIMPAITFVIRTMCVDTQAELSEAYGALAAAGFPPQATAAFDDLTLVDYATLSGPIRQALRSPDPLDQAAWARRLVRHFQGVYARARDLARAGR